MRTVNDKDRRVSDEVDPERNIQRGASIDIGTNSVKVWVAEITEKPFPETIYEDITITKLGENLSDSGRISDEAMERTLRTAGSYAESALDKGAERITVGTTSAVRKASNQNQFLQRAREGWGLNVRVLSGKQEARCTFIGVTYDWSNTSDRLTVFDVGGGSTELIHGQKTDPEIQISAPTGSVQLYEKMNWSDTLGRDELQEAVHLVVEQVHESLSSRGTTPMDTDEVIGVGGTVATLAQVHMGASEFVRRRIEGYQISSEQLLETAIQLAAQTPAERVEQLHVRPGRKEYIIGGAAVVLGVLDALNAGGLQCTCRGLRHGLFFHEFIL